MTRHDPLSRLAVYQRILSHSDADDAKRTHRRTQEAKPRQAAAWLRKSRRLHSVLRLVSWDERHGQTA